MPSYIEHLQKLQQQAQTRFSIVGHDGLGDAVLQRDVGRFVPMLLYVSMELCVASTDPEDAKALAHYDTFYRTYLLLHNGALAGQRDHISIQRELYDYVKTNDAGHHYSLFCAMMVQALCTLGYSSGVVMSGMVSQEPSAVFAHALAQNILNNVPDAARKEVCRYLQDEGVYPNGIMAATLSAKLEGVREMIEEDQARIVERLQALRREEENADVK